MLYNIQQNNTNKYGKVYFIGAGPGDLGLLTLKSLNILQKANVIIYDALINTEVLHFVNSNAILIDAGKRSGNHKLTQNQINQIIIENVKKHEIVVRLKGGDPTIFARISEELDALVKENIEFEIIPGVSSAISAATYAGIPLTSRDMASNLAIVTGHLQDNNIIQEKNPYMNNSKNSTKLNWSAIANFNSIVILMGVQELPNIVENLIKHGKDPNTPISIIQNATTSFQKCIVGSLSNIVELSQKYNISPPAVIVVGNVVNQRNKFMWFEKKPLFNKTFVVTRPQNQNLSLSSTLDELGAYTINLPVIRIEKITNNTNLYSFFQNLLINNQHQSKHAPISSYPDYIIFTSVNGVKIFFDELIAQNNLDARNLCNFKFICIGPKTAQQLLSYGIKPDFVPNEYVSESIIPYFNDIKNKSTVFLFRAKNARDLLIQDLKKIGWNVVNIPLYVTLNNSDNIPEFSKNKFLEFLSTNRISAVIFTSTSTVENFVKYILENLKLDTYTLQQIPAISIGPITSKAINYYNLKLIAQADEYTIEGIIKKILEIYKSGDV